MSLEIVEREDQFARSVIDIESEFINHLAEQASVEYILREGISQELLVSPRSKAIFQFVAHYFVRSNSAPTQSVLQTEFPQIRLDSPGTAIEWIVDKLRERYQRNEIEDIVLKLAELQSTPDQAMPYLRQRFVDLDRVSTSEKTLWRPGDHKMFLEQLREDILQGNYQGASYGFLDIDRFTGGNKPGNVAYLLARPKRQKTFMWLQAFIEQVKHGNKPYLITLELTQKEILMRLSCMLSGLSFDRMQRGELMPADYKAIDEGWELFNEWGEYFIEMPPMDERTVPQMFLKAERVEAEALLISQFKYIDPVKEYKTEFDKYASIAIDLKRSASRPGMEIPVYVEAQYNRAGDSMNELEDFDPSKNGLNDMIAQSADILFGIFQNKDLRANNQLELGILESRTTDKASWYIYSEYKAFTEIRMIADSEH